MNFSFLIKTPLFAGTAEDEIQSMLSCLEARTALYEKGELIFRAGETVDCLGLVLDGSVCIESDDVWGNRSVLGYVGVGEIFAETYACIPGKPMLVNAAAAERTEVLFLNAGKLLQECPHSCACHNRLIRNLLQISAGKNLSLSRKILHTSSKTIRGRLLSYFSEQAVQNGSLRFSIPFNRQQLADYLGVDRSAMCGELSRMQKEGLLKYRKSDFELRSENCELFSQTPYFD